MRKYFIIFFVGMFLALTEPNTDDVNTWLMVLLGTKAAGLGLMAYAGIGFERH